ncbi:outer membrane beta-barrel protein [Mesoterricola sediminis]|uniref:Porin n=1 Tax=Mesoterricola sediminis TaxID=2927980 RepID=A0AA48KB12_9BACT|nr:porin [Mesoterricola sediminis]BDU75634.1 hypothetical protein METESE_05920 [Mesoterricola sediminis]
MRIPLLLLAGGLCLSAEAPAVTWHGALWASATATDRDTPDGSLFLRPLDASAGSFALDGVQLSADVALAEGWAFRFTALGGRMARNLNLASGSSHDGDLAWPEAYVSWTRGADTLKAGRMYTPLGMEVLDGTQTVTASRGLLFTYALPFAQVGLAWHHAFSPSWSADLWVINGEDRLQDNNRGKTVGLGVTWNRGGSPDHFVTLMGFTGPEQDGLGASAGTGAEGRKRSRVSLSGQWVLDRLTLQFEGDAAREDLAPGTLVHGGLRDRATWNGAGLIARYRLTEAWALFGRAEALNDDTGLRLACDPTLAAVLPPTQGVDLQATAFCLGVERRWKQAFTRLEVRRDALNFKVSDAAGRTFKDALSATWQVGASF